MTTALRPPARTVWLLAWLLAWFLFGLFGLLGAGHAAETLRLSALKVPSSLPIFVAEEQGFFASEGLAITLTFCDVGHACLADVLTGRADLAAVPNLPLVFKRFERTDYAVIASIVTTHDTVDLIADRRAGVARAAQLVGKRIGVLPNSASRYYLDLVLAQAGVDSSAVTAVPLKPDQMPEALADGRVDAVSIWEPHTSRAKLALGSRAIQIPGAGLYLDSSNLVAAQRLVGARDATLVAVLRALDRAEAFIQTQPAAAQAIMRRRLGVDQAFAERTWPHLRFRLSLDQTLLATLEAEGRWARREGLVSGNAKPNFLSLFHTAPLKIVKPGAVGMGR